MEILEFNKEELQKIESLLEISSIINNIYNNLYQLEIEGKQDSEDYQKLLKTLEDTRKIEEDKYKKQELSFEDYKKIYKFLLSSNGMSKLSNTECILFQKYDDKVVRRIMNIISKKITLDIRFQKEKIKESDIKILHSLGVKLSINEVYKDMNNDKKIENALLIDILSLLLSILQEFISSKKYNKYKNELIKIKYYISYIYKDIENQMLTYKFNISDSTYISSKMTADLLGINQAEYSRFKEIETMFRASIHIIQYLSIKDSDYESSEKNIEAILRQCYIRSLLSLMSEDAVYDLNLNFHDFVESELYLSVNPNEKISENSIIWCFKSQKYDRPKARSLSFKLPR